MKLQCECAGIGRQARLRGVCRETYGFKSHYSHQVRPVSVTGLFLYLYIQAKAPADHTGEPSLL